MRPITAKHVVAALKTIGTPAKAKSSAWFFKTGKGQYGEGDVFIGVTVPEQRHIARMYHSLPLFEIKKLLQSPIHECRLTALIILVGQYRGGDKATQQKIATFYLRESRYVNNWDLVDTSASNILGAHLLSGRDRKVLYRLVRSKNIWERRIAIIATLAFIKAGEFRDALTLAELLLSDTHDLIHKAVGWMLREVGKESRPTLVKFLKKHAAHMPRTALRYSIEHFSEQERQKFLKMK